MEIHTQTERAIIAIKSGQTLIPGLKTVDFTAKITEFVDRIGKFSVEQTGNGY